ncbi:MAG: efflux RND transporter permease subunit [Burkholderiaceae bacterium]|nr:MAG: efflux RND transporter permease subunit [Burkholderiaceae bacterium]
MWLTRISIHNPVLATMMMVALLVLGLFSYQRMAVDQFPDVTFPVVVVSTAYPGASPENVESDVTRKVEEAVNSINGIKNLYSRSYEGKSVVIIEFELTIDPVSAAADVREKVAAIRPLFRTEVKDPQVTRFDPADQPIISLSVSSPTRDLRTVTTITDQLIKKRLENVRGVGSVTMVGGVKREIQILLKPEAMEALAVGVNQIMDALRSENQELPAGNLRSLQGEQVVQIEGRLKTPDDFRNIIVARRNGNPITLKQVADVRDGEEEIDSLALLNNQRTLALDIRKAQGENTIEVVDHVKETIQNLQAELTRANLGDIKIDVVRDASLPIRTSVKGVKHTLLEGAALTVLIVFLFLNSWRSTVITGLTLPIAIIGTFLVMYMFGFTINMLTLMALSLCVGLLIDDAIVVRENIVRHNLMGKDHHAAALDGTQEIGLAVLATTFSIVAVFLPVGFMGGIIGRFFHQFGITVTAAVLISMFVSFTLDPMLSSVWHDPAIHGQAPKGFIGKLLARFQMFVHWLSDTYQWLLAWALKHRGKTLLFAALTFFGSFALVPFLGSEFVPQPDLSEAIVSFYTPVGSSLELTEAKAKQVDQVLHEFPEVRYTYTTINTADTGKNYAYVYVKLVDRKQRTRSQAALTQPLRERLQQIAGITVTHVGVLNAFSPKPLVISLQGPDQAHLDQYAAEAKERFAKIPGVVDLDTSSKAAKPIVALKLKRELASELGLGIGQVGQALRPLLAGDAVTTWRGPDDENYDVRVRLAPSDRNNLDDLARLTLASNQPGADGNPKMIPLRQIADLTPSLGANQINRRDLAREIQIDANTYGRASGEIGRDMRAALLEMDWKPGYRFVMGGSTKDMQESAGFALSALLLAIIFIYMILASQFYSFIQPLAIMSSLPLTLIGVFLALLIFGSTLNLFSIIGFVMLMGLVTKNAILLIDFTNQARARGVERSAALLEAAHVRLRPILMTTLAMVFGMMPLALGVAEGSEQRAPMGQAVIGGVITSSLLTLVVVPVVYTFLDDLAARLRRKRE